jgi:RNA polymerase sigma-70 factor, ECF subfamily
MRQRSFVAFVRQFQPLLHRLALRLCSNPADAADLVQDTFERALRGFQQLPPNVNERAWATTILHNRFVDEYRRKKRTPIHEPLSDLHPAPEPEAAPPAWLDITPAEVQAALNHIGDEFRVVYELATAHNRSYKDIAAHLKLPTATVGTRLIRARRKLRRLLLAA